jgi:hypothetical protein
VNDGIAQTGREDFRVWCDCGWAQHVVWQAGAENALRTHRMVHEREGK